MAVRAHDRLSAVPGCRRGAGHTKVSLATDHGIGEAVEATELYLRYIGHSAQSQRERTSKNNGVVAGAGCLRGGGSGGGGGGVSSAAVSAGGGAADGPDGAGGGLPRTQSAEDRAIMAAVAASLGEQQPGL